MAEAGAKAKDLWRVNCIQVAEFDDTLAEKEEEIARLREQLSHAGHVGAASATKRSELWTGPETSGVIVSSEDGEQPPPTVLPSTLRRRGKAPPVVLFSGEDPELRLIDWLPSLQRAA